MTKTEIFRFAHSQARQRINLYSPGFTTYRHEFARGLKKAYAIARRDSEKGKSLSSAYEAARRARIQISSAWLDGKAEWAAVAAATELEDQAAADRQAYIRF